MAKSKHSEPLKKKALAMLAEGKSFQEVSRKTRVPANTLGLWKKLSERPPKKVAKKKPSPQVNSLEETLLLKMIDERIDQRIDQRFDEKLNEALKKLTITWQ